MRLIQIVVLIMLLPACHGPNEQMQLKLSACELKYKTITEDVTGKNVDKVLLMQNLDYSFDEQLKLRRKNSELTASLNKKEEMLNDQNRQDLAFSEFCDHVLSISCVLTNAKKNELKQAGVVSDGFFLIVLYLIFFTFTILLIFTVRWLRLIYLMPKKKDVERTQKFIDGAQQFCDDRRKLADEAFYKRNAEQDQQLKDKDLEINNKTIQIELLDETLDSKSEELEMMNIDSEEIEVEIQRRCEIKETLKFDYEDKMD